MSREPRHYISYLLRLWQIRSKGQLVWRASLESPHTGKRRGFASLADLFIYLEQETGQVAQNQTVPKAEKGGDDVRK